MAVGTVCVPQFSAGDFPLPGNAGIDGCSYRHPDAAVEVDGCAGDVTRAIGDEKREQVCELRCVGHSAQRYALLGQLREVRLGVALGPGAVWAVRTRPIQIVLMRILSAAYSLASDLVRLIPAPALPRSAAPAALVPFRSRL